MRVIQLGKQDLYVEFCFNGTFALQKKKLKAFYEISYRVTSLVSLNLSKLIQQKTAAQSNIYRT